MKNAGAPRLRALDLDDTSADHGRGLRVLHVYKDVYPPIVGGIEKHIDGLRRSMPDVRTTVLACSRALRTLATHGATSSEIRVGELGRVLSVPIAPTFPLWLRRQRVDLVHLHMPNPLGEAAWLMSRRDVPLVITYHADIVRQARYRFLYRPLVEACFDQAAAIVAGSQRLLETSPRLAGRAGSVTVVPYGVDTERFDPDTIADAEAGELRQRYGTPLVVAVGRLVYYKGLEYLIGAARGLAASVLIIGPGPLEDRLRTLAADLPNVHLVGLLSEEELVRHLRAADCFVLASTSRAEAFGLATLEAQAMGVPAVVTDVDTGTAEAIVPNESGVVVTPRDAGALRTAITSILADPARGRRMSLAARRQVIERHTLGLQAARLREVYEQAIREVGSHQESVRPVAGAGRAG